MLITKEISKSGDPSDKDQIFKNIKFDILCCRYWWFEIWKGQRMSFPYWRLYWNKNEGAYVYYKNKTQLDPSKIYLIPPHTPFSNGIVNQDLINEDSEYFFKCGKINSKGEESRHLKSGNILHFFVHFTLGFPYDGVQPDVYVLNLSDDIQDNLSYILNKLINESSEFTLKESLMLYNLIINSLRNLPSTIWLSQNIDSRIEKVLEFMERNIGNKITRKILADQLFLSPSAFARLFKMTMGKSPRKYLTQIRIDKASNLLLHSTMGMDRIAAQCGFSDRYHLTKVFSKQKKMSPAMFRKRGGYF